MGFLSLQIYRSLSKGESSYSWALGNRIPTKHYMKGLHEVCASTWIQALTVDSENSHSSLFSSTIPGTLYPAQLESTIGQLVFCRGCAGGPKKLLFCCLHVTGNWRQWDEVNILHFTTLLRQRRYRCPSHVLIVTAQVLLNYWELRVKKVNQSSSPGWQIVAEFSSKAEWIRGKKSHNSIFGIIYV